MTNTKRTSATLTLIPATLILSLSSAAAQPYAPRLENLGDYHHAVTTDDSLAQVYFDQGLILHYGFNHAEAARSFREAQRLDRDCAMAYWGEAMTLGPHINSGMSRAAVSAAWSALAKARELAPNVSQKEQDYIEALAARYEENPSGNRASLDRAYADAMRKPARKYPDDPDAQTLFAEALMITTAWDYWQADGSPNAVTKEILSTLEGVMEHTPRHPGANHFYIHTVEMEHPERGLEAAKRIGKLVPGIGHLVHMPSHIYLPLGRYAEASDANAAAVEADREYLEKHGAHGMFRISYIPHNALFLWYSTSMEGRGQRCLEAANILRDLILEDPLHQPGYGSLTQGFSTRYYAMARFGMWDSILTEPSPPEDLDYPTAVWHYSRGMAFLRTGEQESARDELQKVRDMSRDDVVRKMDVWNFSTAQSVLQIAGNMLAGEIEAAVGNYDKAMELLREAVTIEDNLGYYEPPAWHAPARQTLGAILLDADRPEHAEKVYRADLKDYPHNGWSLFGLYQALDRLGRDEEAQRVYERYQRAWSRADVELTSSRM